MFGGFIRRVGFWTVDFLRGGVKRSMYLDIVNNGDHNAEEKLADILKYARAHVPFYKNVESNALCDFPVMTKLRYREGSETDYFSDTDVGQNLHIVYTSGSTGTPFKVVQDLGKRNRTIVDLIHCHKSIGWELGDKYVFIRNWVSNYKQSKLKSLAQNVHNVNITDFDDERKRALTKWLEKKRKVVLFGYASAVHEYAVFLQKQGIDGRALKIKLIVVDSDMLTAMMRQRLEDVFGCPVYNRYDNEENGLLGINRSQGEPFELNTSSLYFELLQLDADQPVQPGQLGRLVITDLHNRAMPLIRYDTGDLAVTTDLPGHIKTIDALYGRAAGCLTNTEGRLVSDVALSGAMEPFVDIVKYQMVQKPGHTYCLKFAGKISPAEQKELESRLYSCFGANAILELMSVDDIPCGPNGKHKTSVTEVAAV